MMRKREASCSSYSEPPGYRDVLNQKLRAKYHADLSAVPSAADPNTVDARQGEKGRKRKTGEIWSCASRMLRMLACMVHPVSVDCHLQASWASKRTGR